MSKSWLASCGVVVWALCALPCYAQSDADEALVAARAAEPAKGLELVEAALTRELPPAQRDRARLLRAELLGELSRLAEAQRAWETLLDEGHDVSAKLLELAGAELELRLASAVVRSGRPTALELWGRATGPLGLRLYAVDANRFRGEVGPRSLGARLRTPPRSGLTRRQAWSLAALDGSSHAVTLPALKPGLYLLTATCRGVRVNRALCVADLAAGVQRDAAGTRVAVFDAETGVPRPAAWTLLDEDARALRGLPGDTPLSEFREPRARAAFAWFGDAPVWLDLPPAVEAVEAPPQLVTELGSYRPGQTIRVRVRDGLPMRPLRLVAPNGVEVRRVLVRPPFEGSSSALLELPEFAPPGTWSLAHGPTQTPLDVLPLPSGLRELRVDAPAASTEARPLIRVSGCYRARGPLAGVAVRLEAHWTPATWDEGTRGPLPPWRMSTSGPEVLLETQEAVLDAEGLAELRIAAPQAAGVVHVRVWVRDAPGDGSGCSFAWAPADLALRLHSPHAVAVQSRFFFTGSMAQLSGGGLPNAAAVLTVEGPESFRLDLRTDNEGKIRKALALDLPGSYRATLSAVDAAGRKHAVTREVLAVASLVDPAVSPASGPGGLLRREGETLEVLAWAGGALGSAVLQVEPAAAALQVLPIVEGVLRARVDCPPGAAVRVVTLTDGAVRWLELTERVEAATLEPVLTVEANRVLHVSVLREGVPVAGRVQVSTLDAAAALSAARRAEAPLAAGARWVHALAEVSVPVEGVTLELPPAEAGKLSWVRVVARAAGGGHGEAWLPRGATPSVTLDLALPKHLVEGDTAELAVRLLTPGPGLWRLRYEREGVHLGQARVVAGGRVDPRRAVGGSEVALEVSGPVLLSIPLRAKRGSEASGRVRVFASSEDGTQAAEAQASLAVYQPGVWTTESWTGFARPGAEANWELSAPARPKGRSRLEVAASPNWATAGLSALRALGEDVRPLAGLWGLRGEESLRAAFRARRLTPPDWDPSQRQRLDEFAPRLALSWNEADAWGVHAPDVALELIRLDQAGFAVSPELRRRALAAAVASGGPTALYARALAGELAGVTNPDPEETSADALAVLARALHETGPVARQRLVLAQALEARDRLSPHGAVTLWEALRESGRTPPPDLLTRALGGRRGAGWRNPATAGLAVLSLAEATHAGAEQPGERIRVYVQDALWYEAWTGGGLSEWTPWVRRVGGKLRPGLAVRVEAYRGPVYCSGLFSTRIRPAQPGGSPVKRWFSHGGKAVQSVPYGQPFSVEIELGADPPPGSLLEVPLPGGCRLLRPLPDARERDGSVWLAPSRQRISLPVLATQPGRYWATPANWEPTGAPRGWSTVERLEVTGPTK